MKKLFLMIMVTVCICTLPACGASTALSTESGASPVSGEKQAARVFKLGNAGGKEERAAEACRIFCELANERLNGEIVFEFYPAAQLGDEKTMLNNLKDNSQQGVMTAIDTLANYSADLNIISLAFAFDSHEQVFQYLESDLAKPAFEKLEEQGIHVLNFYFQKNPRILFGKQPFVTPADMENLKFRVPDIPIFKRNIAQLGAIPTVVSWSEYPFALMQGIVDAGECTKEAMYACGFYDSCKYVSEVDYSYPVEALSISVQAWESLTPEQREILEECAMEAARQFNEKVETSWLSDKQKLIAAGVTFVDFDKQSFIDKMKPLASDLDAEGFWDTPNLYEKVRRLNKDESA